jgi:hypothetical protein
MTVIFPIRSWRIETTNTKSEDDPGITQDTLPPLSYAGLWGDESPMDLVPNRVRADHCYRCDLAR